MKFTRKLNYEEIKALSIEDDRLYHRWLQEEQRKTEKAKRQNWTFEDWKAEAFTFNNFAAARRDFFLEEERIAELVKSRVGDKKEKFTFFSQTESPFSESYNSVFIGPIYMWENKFYKKLLEEGFPEKQKFISIEQWMMYCKAMVFLDLETADYIMKTNDPNEIKNLGLKVKKFNENTWKVYRWRFVYQGNKYKFTQNDDLNNFLSKTNGTTLVNASPQDKIWGIGLEHFNEKAKKRSNWEGMNLLGEILTELRINLMGEY
ncbi:hypothetical protein GCM10009117_14640 [Gangjinia marincola]|uniref:NADAR domain-containing protein n=1 Tax=Gangjinia marincola TaxID=578463 RepID=A0ABP3XVE7_9FLAO